MSTNAPPMPMQQGEMPSAAEAGMGQGAYPPEFNKAADAAEQALGQMYKICHQQEPGSPLCDALTNIMAAVAEIEATAGTGGPPNEPAPEEMAAMEAAAPPVPGGAPAPMEAGPPAMSGNPDMAAAAAEATAMMNNNRRASA